MTKTMAEACYVLLGSCRIQWCKWLDMGTPKTTPASSIAAAGVWTGLGSTLRCTGEGAGGGYGLLVLR